MRVLQFSQLKSLKGIPFSRPHVDRLEKAGQFPARIQLGTHSVGWIDEDIDVWLTKRKRGPLPALSAPMAAKRAAQKPEPEIGEAAKRAAQKPEPEIGEAA